MITNILISTSEMAGYIALAAKEKRLALNLSQKSLSERSGVSFGVIKKFERTGKISLESLLKLALTLGALKDFSTYSVQLRQKKCDLWMKSFKINRENGGGSDPLSTNKGHSYRILPRKRYRPDGKISSSKS